MFEDSPTAFKVIIYTIAGLVIFGKIFGGCKDDTLTTEQKVELYTEREASGSVGNRNWEIRKAGDQRVIVIEEDGEKIYLPVKE